MAVMIVVIVMTAVMTAVMAAMVSSMMSSMMSAVAIPCLGRRRGANAKSHRGYCRQR
jgi:hypothetical protein